MRNIPTDLLRAFITVVDLKGYTRAGERLGRSQPAISLQLKRLQELLGVKLFEREGGDARLTEHGELVANHARRMLAINDELVLKLAKKGALGRIRIGIPNDYADHFLPRLLPRLDAEQEGLSFEVTCDLSGKLLTSLRAEALDIVVAMTPDGPAEGAYMTWREALTWVGCSDLDLRGSEKLVRLVAYPEGCLYRRAMLAALQREGRAFDIVYTSQSLTSLEAAVTTGFGITALARRIVKPDLIIAGQEHRLPSLSDVMVGIYIREGTDRSHFTMLAARIADLFMDSKAQAV